MTIMINDWILKNGLTETKFTSFPYAFRAMFNIAKKATEQGKYAEAVKAMKIISPLKDAHGDPKTYSYASATEMAKSSGLLTPDGQINSREFKRR